MSCIYPIGGGKGGIGKSFIAANLGVLLAKQGNRVVLVDLDLGGANLHTFTGMPSVKTGIEKFLDKTAIDLNQVAVPTEINNLSIISSVNCSMEIANLFAAQKLKIIKAIQKLPFDYILLDLGAGTNYNTLDFFLSSNEGILLLTPEPTSIENAFKFIKAVYLRKVRQILNKREFRSVTDCIA
ncbi:MAG: AAA family ATPase, partial [Deltaproteobacteria bacterium]|nr:AAA family ATPase [Deltaproteobacteria bacterium]